ncbi:MAG: polyribonucleotide nucleotidyltransferase [Planctomycetota bacterium]|jgi:polyribonucleotide nucleotidyltransferase
MKPVKVEREVAGRTLLLETGKLAKQAHGAVWVRYGDSVVLATVLSAPAAANIDFFPLYVDYREATYSAGKIPGGFFKREGRPTASEVVTMRMIDRPIRPLFPRDLTDEVQIQCLTLSYDGENEPDLLAVIGASAAMVISPVPFDGPLGAARVGYIDEQLVLNPTRAQLDEGEMDLVVCGPREAVNMIEFAGREVPEDILAAGIEKGFEVCKTVIEMLDELSDKCNAGQKKAYEPDAVPDELKRAIREKYGQQIRQAEQIVGKVERTEAMAKIKEDVMAEYFPEDPPQESEPAHSRSHVAKALYQSEGEIQRELISSGSRPDGRAADEVRPLRIEIGVLPRTHGSALFTRGETQALVMTTLGTPRDQVIIDGIREEYKKPFYLHYNFPPFSVGQIKPIRGPSRRDFGHGMLAEKALAPVMPTSEAFPYTVRVVSELLESNGSTSQATICGASLALMDAGVPIKRPVAGISIGMVSDGDGYTLLSDIVGDEDFHGDMDFKVSGTEKGVTAIQLDMKARGITQDRIVETLERARRARLYILGEMKKVIPEPRREISEYAPRMIILKIDTDKIGKVIGPAGKTINRIQDETGAIIEIEDDGTVFISSTDADSANAAKETIEALTAEVEVGKIYEGKVVSIRDFGAFVEILPGQDGMCHVSELDEKYVKKVTDICNVGDAVLVKVTAIDDQGRVRLSRKAAMKAQRAGNKS